MNLDHPLLWRGRQRVHALAVLSTGHAALDTALPGHGWPLGALTEIIHANPGCGELSLLLPALAHLGQAQHWTIMIDPPWIPYPPTLCGHGLVLEKLLLVHTHGLKKSLWACQQALGGITGGAVLAWLDKLTFAQTRSLQLAAKGRQNMAFVFCGNTTAASPSPAALRLQLSADQDGLRVRVLKCRGQRPASDIRLSAGAICGLTVNSSNVVYT